jgi:hypothetical protein
LKKKYMKKQLATPRAVAPAKANVAEVTMEIQVWPIDKLVAYARNPRKNDATSAQDVARLLGERKPPLMVTDPCYGIQLDSEWRDKAALNKHKATGCGYVKKRTKGHQVTKISGDTRADWSDAFALVPSLELGYVWHASTFTREVLDGLLRIGFLYHQQIIWDKGRAVLTRTHYWFAHEPCWYVRKTKALTRFRSSASRRRVAFLLT